MSLSEKTKMSEPALHSTGKAGLRPVAAVGILDLQAAERRISGVSAIGRVVREIAEAGFSDICLVIPEGGDFAALTREDIARLAPAAKVRITTQVPAGETVAFAPDCLVSAEEIVTFMAGPALELLHDGKPVALREHGSGSAVAADALWLDERAGYILLKRTVKSGDGVVSRWINRRISRPISALMLMFPGARPMHGTIGTALLGIAMIAALLTGSKTGMIWGALLFQAASIFDGVDGEMARVTFRSSRQGAALDSTIDIITNLAFLAGLTYSLTVQGVTAALYLGTWSVCAMALGLWLIGRRTVQSGNALGFDLIKHKMKTYKFGAVARGIITFFTALTSRDGFAFLFALLVVSGVPLVSLIIFATVAALWLTTVIVSLFPRKQAAPREGSVSVR